MAVPFGPYISPERLKAIREGFRAIGKQSAISVRRETMRLYAEYEKRTGKKVSARRKREDKSAREKGFKTKREERNALARSLGYSSWSAYEKTRAENNKWYKQMVAEYMSDGLTHERKVALCVGFSDKLTPDSRIVFITEKRAIPRGLTYEQYVDLYFNAWVSCPDWYKPIGFNKDKLNWNGGKNNSPRYLYFHFVEGMTPDEYFRAYGVWRPDLVTFDNIIHRGKKNSYHPIVHKQLYK